REPGLRPCRTPTHNSPQRYSDLRGRADQDRIRARLSRDGTRLARHPMKFGKRLLRTALAVLLCGAAAGAQEAHRHEGQTPEIGQVNFVISCGPSARQRFNRAVAWLHSFEYDRAEAEFVAAAESDPACPMCYWGVAMSCYHPLWAPPGPAELKKGAAAVEKAR